MEIEITQNWEPFSEDLATGKKQKKLLQRLGAKTASPLLWLLNSQTFDLTAAQQLEFIFLSGINPNDKNVSSQIADLQFANLSDAVQSLHEDLGRPASPAFSLNALGIAHALSGLASRLITGEPWWSVLELLIELTKSEDSQNGFNDSIGIWQNQMLRVELPLTLAFLLPESKQVQRLCQPAISRLVDSVEQQTDLDGWPHADCLSSFGPLLASWARSKAILDHCQLEFPAAAQTQLEWTVRQALRLFRFDGTLMFAGVTPTPISPECLTLLLKISANSTDKKLAKQYFDGQTGKLRSNRKTKSTKKSKRNKSLPSPSSLSEWGQSGILRGGWDRRAAKLGFQFTNHSCHLEISSKKTLVEGCVMPLVTVDGQSLQPQGDFDVVCESYDFETDYIELEMELSDSAVLTRQLLLSRTESFLLVTDSVALKTPGKLEYQCDWPLPPSMEAMGESETREVYLRDKKIQALVLPLALPEWKVERAEGRLDCLPAGLRLSQSIDGAGIHAPLFFDLSPKRSKSKRTWRRLTVAENMQKIRPDEAVAFRIQLNNDQWFYYRVITKPGNHTFLGENFIGEFVFNRFDREGTVRQLVCIES